MALKEDIIYLRSLGKTYDQISMELGCSKSTISYHLDDRQKTKQLERNKTFRASRVYGSHLMNYLGVDPRRSCDTFDESTVSSPEEFPL